LPCTPSTFIAARGHREQGKTIRRRRHSAGSDPGQQRGHANDMMGSCIARISERDHHASDGYTLDNAAQIVRQDRANWHRFHQRDRDDEVGAWFRTDDQRARLQRKADTADRGC